MLGSHPVVVNPIRSREGGGVALHAIRRAGGAYLVGGGDADQHGEALPLAVTRCTVRSEYGGR